MSRNNVHRDIPDPLSKAETVNQVEGHGHVHGIDRHDLVVHLAIVHVAVWKVDVVGVNIKRDDRGVIDDAASVDNLDKWTVVVVAYSPGLRCGRRELITYRPGRDAADGRKVNGPFCQIPGPHSGPG
jgi:hypothetical protein